MGLLEPVALRPRPRWECGDGEYEEMALLSADGDDPKPVGRGGVLDAEADGDDDDEVNDDDEEVRSRACCG